MSKPFLADPMGSDSNWGVMLASLTVLKNLGISFEAKMTIAPRASAATYRLKSDGLV